MSNADWLRESQPTEAAKAKPPEVRAIDVLLAEADAVDVSLSSVGDMTPAQAQSLIQRLAVALRASCKQETVPALSGLVADVQGVIREKERLAPMWASATAACHGPSLSKEMTKEIALLKRVVTALSAAYEQLDISRRNERLSGERYHFWMRIAQEAARVLGLSEEGKAEDLPVAVALALRPSDAVKELADFIDSVYGPDFEGRETFRELHRAVMCEIYPSLPPEEPRSAGAPRVEDAAVLADANRREEDKPSAVNHPPHYNFGTIEVITVIEDWRLSFSLGNAVKYIARAPHKGSQLEDLRKAEWYLKREIQLLEKTT